MNNQVMNFDLYGASFADIDGNQYVSLFVGQAVEDEQAENAKGIIIMKMSCDVDVYRSLDISKYPARVEAQVKLKKAAGGKMGQHCVKITPKQSSASPAASAAGKAS